MTCPDCIANAARVLALEEELKAYRVLVDGTDDERVTRILGVALDLGPRGARLVNILWTAQGRPVPGGLIADTMWPQAEPDRADASVRQAVLHVRQALGRSAVTTVGGAYLLGDDAKAAVARALPPELLPGAGSG